MAKYCPSPESVTLFNGAVHKAKEDLTPEEFRSIVACYGWLNDDEKKKFNIKRSDLLQDEIDNYIHLTLLDVYFKN